MNIKINKYTLLALAIAIISIFILFKVVWNQNVRLKEVKSLYETAQDTIQLTRNDLGQQVAKVSVLQTENEKTLLKLKTQDENIIQLQKLVTSEIKKRRDVEVAIVIKNQTIVSLKDSIINTIAYYTQFNDSIYPVYKRKYSDKWINTEVQLGRNIFQYDLQVSNEYTITIGQEPDGLFRKKNYAELVNLNPYSSTKAMKVYQKTPVKNKTVLTGIKVGFVGLVAGFILGKL